MPENNLALGDSEKSHTEIELPFNNFFRNLNIMEYLCNQVIFVNAATKKKLFFLRNNEGKLIYKLKLK
jgi:hypothetical protein